MGVLGLGGFGPGITVCDGMRCIVNWSQTACILEFSCQQVEEPREEGIEGINFCLLNFTSV